MEAGIGEAWDEEAGTGGGDERAGQLRERGGYKEVRGGRVMSGDERVRSCSGAETTRSTNQGLFK